jgi:hypothetical protein
MPRKPSPPAPAAKPAPARAALVPPFRAALYGCLILFVLTLLCYDLDFATNDDAGMNLLAAGQVYANAPDEHLLFTNVLIGLALKGLYTAAPNVPWYGWYLVGSLFLAAVGLSYAFLRVNPTGKQWLLAGLFLVVVVMGSLTELQFTKVAFLASLAGLFLLCVNLLGVAPRPWVVDGAAVGLMVLGSLIRFDSFGLAGVLALPVLLFTALCHRDRRRWLREGLVLSGTGVLCLALNGFNGYYYSRSEGWRDFYAYNAVRAQFTDSFSVTYNPHTRPAFEATGWHPVDLAMMVSWFYTDERRYSLEKLRTLAAAASPEDRALLGRDLSGLFGLVRKDREAQFVLCLGVCLAAAMTAGRWSLAVVAAEFVLAAAAAVVLHSYFHLPPHVLLVLCVAPAATAVLLNRGGGSFKGTGLAGWARAALLVVAVVLAVFAVGWRFQGGLDLMRKKNDKARLLSLLGPREDQLYVAWGNALDMQDFVHPLGNLEGLRRFKCLHLGVPQTTPIAKARMREFGIDDLYLAICRKPNVFLVSDQDLNNLFTFYVYVHYGLRPEFGVVFAPLRVCKVTAVTPASPGKGSGR